MAYGRIPIAECSLLGAALRNRFDRQTGGLTAGVVFQHAGQARINDIFDAGNRQGRLRDIGCDDDFLPR